MVENSSGGGSVGGKCFTAGWNVVAKPCDICKSATTLLLCRKHNTFLCMACDSKLPANTKDERVSIDLYSADNPFFDFGFAIPTDVTLDNHLHDSVNDCVVPVQTTTTKIIHHKSPYEIDLTRSASMNSYNKNSLQTNSHSVCTSPIEPGVVSEENSMLDISSPLIIPVNVGGMNVGPKARQFCAVDREARVLRYREKRKNRKFEKKIRYASRKAYAEKQPRIKGRFVKRTELRTELDVDRWLFTPEANISSYGPEIEYGVVLSF